MIGVGGGGGGLGGGIVTGTSLEVSKKAPATHADFDFFQKNSDFENSSWIFFYLKKFLNFFAEIQRIIFKKTNYDRSFKEFAEDFFSENTPDFET